MTKEKCKNCGRFIEFKRQENHRGVRGLRVPKDADGEDHLKNCTHERR